MRRQRRGIVSDAKKAAAMDEAEAFLRLCADFYRRQHEGDVVSLQTLHCPRPRTEVESHALLIWLETFPNVTDLQVALENDDEG